MSTLSVREIYDAARAAGFSPQQAVTWTGIAMAESRGRPDALNSKGEHSVGLWQINIRSGVRENTWGDLTNPRNNARAAYEISNSGRDMRPWTTTHDRNKGTAADYRRYLPAIEREIGVQGDDRGVPGYGAKLPPPLPEDSYDRIDPGQSLTEPADDSADGSAQGPRTLTGWAQPDADGDGLTDAFEQLAAGPPADTDADGLTDETEEVLGTDRRRADTDADRVADAAELAAGTDPLRSDPLRTDPLRPDSLRTDPLGENLGGEAVSPWTTGAPGGSGLGAAGPRPAGPYHGDAAEVLDLT